MLVYRYQCKCQQIFVLILLKKNLALYLKNLHGKKILHFCFNKLNADDIQNKIKLFMKKDFDKTNSLNAAAEFSNIIKDAAATSLQTTHNRKAATVSKGKNNKRNKNNSRNKNLKWYDFSLRKARLVLVNIEKLFRKFSHDPYVRSSFYKSLKEFRKLRKRKL